MSLTIKNLNLIVNLILLYMLNYTRNNSKCNTTINNRHIERSEISVSCKIIIDSSGDALRMTS